MYSNVHNAQPEEKQKKKELKISSKNCVKYIATTNFTFKEVNQSQGTCIKNA